MNKGLPEFLRQLYPEGTRVRLIYMKDDQAPEPGTCGTVQGVDDMANILMQWDDGSSLSLIFKEDLFEKVFI